jgi:hypothetical protein
MMSVVALSETKALMGLSAAPTPSPACTPIVLSHTSSSLIPLSSTNWFLSNRARGSVSEEMVTMFCSTSMLVALVAVPSVTTRT